MTPCSARPRLRARPGHLSACSTLLGRVAYYPSVQFGGERVDLPSQLGVGLELQFLRGEVKIRLGLLERRLPVLADHDERGQEDRLKRRSASASAAAQEQLDHISMAWAAAQPRARLMPAAEGPYVARRVVGSPAALLVPDRVIQDAVDLLCGVGMTRLGRCPVEAGGCGWLFLDHSRNRSRRSCTMEDYGSGAKSRRLTERRRQSRAQV